MRPVLRASNLAVKIQRGQHLNESKEQDVNDMQDVRYNSIKDAAGRPPTASDRSICDRKNFLRSSMHDDMLVSWSLGNACEAWFCSHPHCPPGVRTSPLVWGCNWRAAVVRSLGQHLLLVAIFCFRLQPTSCVLMQFLAHVAAICPKSRLPLGRVQFPGFRPCKRRGERMRRLLRLKVVLVLSVLNGFLTECPKLMSIE